MVVLVPYVKTCLELAFLSLPLSLPLCPFQPGSGGGRDSGETKMGIGLDTQALQWAGNEHGLKMHSPVSKPTQKGNLSHLQQEWESKRKDFLFYCWVNVENAVSWNMNIRTLLQRWGTKKGFLFLLFASLWPWRDESPLVRSVDKRWGGIAEKIVFIHMQKMSRKRVPRSKGTKNAKNPNMLLKIIPKWL